MRSFFALVSVLILSFALPVPCLAKTPPPPVAGSYRPAKVTSSPVKKAAQYAVQERAKKTGKKLKLDKIISAETQVVAGVNYRLRLRVVNGKKSSKVTALVYQNLKGRYSLQGWK